MFYRKKLEQLNKKNRGSHSQNWKKYLLNIYRDYLFCWVVLVHNTRSNDSRSNNAWFMHKLCKHANKDKSWYQRSRNISVICKYLFPEWRKQVWSKKSQLLKFSNENDLTKLVVDIWRNFSNRLCQLTLPEFHTFSNFTISLIF